MAVVEIPSKHKALVYDNLGSISTRIKEIDTPKPGPGEVLVNLTHSGVCHSDMGIMCNAWAWLPTPPPKGQVGGHEGVGKIVALGQGTENIGLKIGDRQYTIAPAHYVTPIPDTLPSDMAAPMLCGGVTVYSALSKCGAKPGEWVVISGAGAGLGPLALQIGSRGMGFRIIGIDMGEKEKLVKDSGAEVFFNLAHYPRDDEGAQKLVTDVKAATGGSGAAATVVCTGNNAAYGQGLRFLKFRGTLVCVGVLEGTPRAIATADPASILGQELRIVGSTVGNRKDAIETLDMAARGVVKRHFKTQPMDKLNEAFQRMDRNQLQGRVVLDLSR